MAERIGKNHGLLAFTNWLEAAGEWQKEFAAWAALPAEARALEPPPVPPSLPGRGPRYDAADLSTWPWPDRLARTLGILAADHDSLLPAGPPPPTAMPIDPVFQRDLVFTRTLSNFSGIERDAARAAGFSVLLVQLDNTPYVDANRNEISLIRSELEAKGWLLGGWATYGQDTNDPRAEARRHASIARELGLVCWLANGEDWAENTLAWKSSAYVTEWRGAGAPVPLAVSCLSSPTSGWARAFDYKPWLDHPGAAVCPQVYCASVSGYTVANMIDTMTRGGVPLNRLAPAFNLLPDPPGPKGWSRFDEIARWSGPRSIWTGDDSTVEAWQKLAR